jgi:hypothetical protein
LYDYLSYKSVGQVLSGALHEQADEPGREERPALRYLAKAPAVLRGLIRLSHAEHGIRAGLTEETLAGVDRWEPGYRASIRAPRLQGPEALLAAVGALDSEEYLDAVEVDELR